MIPSLFRRVLVPVASEDDAAATSRALGSHIDGDSTIVALHVIEKAGGAPDKASVEQREAVAESVFATMRDALPDTDLETRVAYGTDVADTVFHVADETDASSIVFTPRGGSRWIRLLTGDVALSLITETDRPVVVLPDVEDDER